MRIARVVGNLVSTVKDEALRPYKLLLVEYLNPMTMEPEDGREIATDCVDAGVGDIVVVDTDGVGRVTLSSGEISLTSIEGIK